MRILVISDIHANLTALDAVLEDAGQVDAVWCLGDLVGYGPDPNEVIDRIANLPYTLCVLGNHDAAALGQIDLDSFNTEARETTLWNQDSLTRESKYYLTSLRKKTVRHGFTLTHGSPRNSIWEYILDVESAADNLDYFITPFCLIGHTHIPIIYHTKNGKSSLYAMNSDNPLSTQLTGRAILNPGSVGQPRDADPRACYAILDLRDKTWDQRRVSYDISAVQQRIIRSGLPVRNGERLFGGW
jgi:predicted phosphodiesterase